MQPQQPSAQNTPEQQPTLVPPQPIYQPPPTQQPEPQTQTPTIPQPIPPAPTYQPPVEQPAYQPPATPTETSSSLFQATWRVTSKDGAIMKAQVIGLLYSLVAIVIVVGLFFGSFYATNMAATKTAGNNSVTINQVAGVVAFIALLFVSSVITTWTNAIVVWIAHKRFLGEPATFKDGVARANEMIQGILAYSAVNTTVGLILRATEERVPFGVHFAVWFVGAAWSIANIFSLQHMIITGEKNPFKALKISAELFRKAWGQSAFVGLGAVGIAFLVMFGYLALVALLFWIGFMVQNLFLVIGLAAIAFAVAVFLNMIYSALITVVVTALYYYSVNGTAPAGFDNDLLRGSMKPKKQSMT